MYKCTFLFLATLALIGLGSPDNAAYANQDEGWGGLAERTAASISDYFNNQHNIKIAVVKFENTAGISDLTAQRFYQLLVSKLETAGTLDYSDLMIDFQQKHGEFNLNRIPALNHLVYLKLTRDKNKIGSGISIFSLVLDRIVFIKYLEEPFTAEEEEIYNITDFGFTAQGFSKIIEMEANPGLLDLKSFLDQKGSPGFLFYYPEEIQLFKLNGTRLNKILSSSLQWGKPYFPVREAEGKLCVFFQNNQLYAAVGGNFSPSSKILAIKEGPPGEISEVETLDFIPFRPITLNNGPYLAGARYNPGKNFFQDRCIVLPLQFTEGRLVKDKYLEKTVPAFYALDFSTTAGETKEAENTLNSIHIIDRDYQYRFWGDHFQELVVERAQRGSALCCLGEQWLAVSDFSTGTDQLYFYAIEKGGRRLVFQNPLEGEIIFISDGLWKAAPGFWVYVKQSKPNTTPGYKLQFWSKKNA